MSIASLNLLLTTIIHAGRVFDRIDPYLYGLQYIFFFPGRQIAGHFIEKILKAGLNLPVGFPAALRECQPEDSGIGGGFFPG
jgi:hypothetical protein